MDTKLKSEADLDLGSASSSDSEDLEEENASNVVTSAHWTPEERALLLASVKQYGMLNVDQLSSILKTKTAHQIKEFFRRVSRAVHLDRRSKAIASARLKLLRCTKNRTAHKLLKQAPMKKLWNRLFMTELGQGPIDWWLKHVEHTMKGDSGALMAAEMIPRAFSIITQYEDHPHPSKCGGVDLREAYDYLYHMLSGVPPKTLQPQTALFIQRSIRRLLQTLKDAMYSSEVKEQYGEQVNFLMEFSGEDRKIPAQTYGAHRKRHSPARGLLSPSLAMKRLIGQNSFNPLKVPESLTWKQTACQTPVITPSAVKLCPFESSIDDPSVPCGLFSDSNTYREHCVIPNI